VILELVAKNYDMALVAMGLVGLFVWDQQRKRRIAKAEKRRQAEHREIVRAIKEAGDRRSGEKGD
jgi:hypothetical protein